ncbi:MAG: type II/IV secretion system ATPase subunit [Candidatus Thermoplasmatota archaeon]
MGLLEKGQEKKEHPIITEEPPVIKRKKRPLSRQTRKEMENQAILEAYRIFTPEKISERPRSLLEKAQQKKESESAGSFGQTLELFPPEQLPTEAPTDKAPEEDDASLVIQDTVEQNIEVIDEQTGFGWKEQGKKQIVYDHNSHEFLYKVIEPQLNEEQKKTKDEIAHLFKMMADIDTVDMDFEEKEKFLEETIERIISDNRIYLEEESKDIIYYHVFRDFLGYGRIDILMHDDGIEDISADGPSTPIFIHHRKYEAIETNIYFDSEHELNSFLVRLCQISGKQISIFSPIVDGKLPDGSRLQATLARTVTKGSTFTIRKFKEIPLTPIDLIEYNSMSTEIAAYFWMAIEDGASILFCGGTASGKTTALNALMLFIPASHKIISIEDTREVNIPHKNWIAGTTRKGFAASDESKTGKDIDMFDLIRAALRQRPRVIIVGEVRGKEAYSLFQAMATGHTAYATVHASTIHTLIQRLENPPIELPRALLTSLDIIVFQNAVDIGGKMVRRMTSVTEIIKLDPDTNQLIFMAPYTWLSKTDDRFESAGSSKILNRIKQQNDWTDEQLVRELNNRIIVLEWMRKKKIKSYKKFGRIIADYKKFPEKVLELAQRELEE